MKKHEIIKTGYDKYTKGTRFKCIETKDEIVSNGNFIINGYNRLLHVNENNLGKGVVCKVIDCELKWAEIVKPKIAIKVDLKQSKILCKHLGLKHDLGEFRGEIAIYLNRKHEINTGSDICWDFVPNTDKDYQIIPFADFAEEKGIKLPLLTSEDGVDLYDGDRYFMFDYEKGTNGEFDDFRGEGFKASYFPLKTYEKQPAIFSTKQAALSWIEAHKPKEIVLEFGAYKFTIKKDSINVSHGDSDAFIDINSIHKAFLELN